MFSDNCILKNNIAKNYFTIDDSLSPRSYRNHIYDYDSEVIVINDFAVYMDMYYILKDYSPYDKFSYDFYRIYFCKKVSRDMFSAIEPLLFDINLSIENAKRNMNTYDAMLYSIDDIDLFRGMFSYIKKYAIYNDYMKYNSAMICIQFNQF